MPMNEYRVTWEIEVTAESEQEAVKLAVKWLAPQEPTRWAYQAQDCATGELLTLEGEDLF